MQRFFLCWTAGTASLLHFSYSSALAYERPLHLAIASATLSAITLYIATHWFPWLFEVPKQADPCHEVIELRYLPHVGQAKKHENEHEKTPDQRGQKSITLCAAVLLALRIDVFRRIRGNEECTSRSYESFVPLILAIYKWRSQSPVEILHEARPDNSMYDDLTANLRRGLLKPKWRYVPPALAIAVGCYGLTDLQKGQTSTIVCSISSGHAAWIPRLRVAELILDSFLLVLFDSIAGNQIYLSGQLKSVRACANIFVGGVGIWVAVIVGMLIRNVDTGSWILLLRIFQRSSFFWSITWQAILVASFVLSSTCLVLRHGVFPISMLLTIVTMFLPGIHFVWNARQPYPQISAGNTIWLFSLVVIGVWWYTHISQTIFPSQQVSGGSSIALPLFILFVALWPEFTKNSSVYFHPIDLLMHDARNQHDGYLHFATYSNDLHSAVAVYTSRYQSNPPPKFDTWWAFAEQRNATITDDFDQIYVDLLPFRTVSPAYLRQKTLEMVSDPSNEVAGISIRDGQVKVMDSTMISHRWMLDGISTMIATFARHLPDMDLAFNLNDLPRIAMSQSQSSKISTKARQVTFKGASHLQQNRAASWKRNKQQDSQEALFEDWSMQNTFDQFGSISCPASSTARRMYHNMFQPYTCLSCATVHSLGQFVSNWSLAADPCHQPDLRQLYGPYLAPAAFKASHKLLPVFSQSKMHGFRDVLYPSGWNYLETVAYSPTSLSNTTSDVSVEITSSDLPFAHKLNSLYWRGSTTEGVSRSDRLWRGMARQRLVHMANNLTTSYHDHATVLLPDPGTEGKYSYNTLSAEELLHLRLETDIHIEDHIAQCAGADCAEQEQELGTVPPSDFQQHWKYRFLFDLDGPGSTGHFIPFLKSHSLPFKAGMLREWFDSRLTPWRHFVPQDLRLHGLWSTLAYFAGIDGSLGRNGRTIKWDAHVREAELIAEEGRNWANQVLRKEDMEIYMFRLLLEWARLTDDRRDELGFTLE